MALTLNKLTKSFGEKTLFRDFTYIFQQTGIYVIKGVSGVGKTTLLRMISGLDSEYSGNITGGGFGAVSVCFQEHRLFPNLTALENITKISFDKETEDNIRLAKELLKRLNFSDEDMELFPSELSGGMRQRVAFARAVLKKSDILILDEVTKELDAALVKEIVQIIKEEAERRLVLAVTHNDDDIESLDATVIFLE